MSGKIFGQKSKCLGLNRDFQANPGGFCLERGYFVSVWRGGVLSVYASLLLSNVWPSNTFKPNPRANHSLCQACLSMFLYVCTYYGVTFISLKKSLGFNTIESVLKVPEETIR
jgi:hypothetical protein